MKIALAPRACPSLSRRLRALALGVALASACSELALAQQSFDVTEASLRELQLALTAKRVSSVELVDAYLARIEAYDDQGPGLNALIHFNPEAGAQAAALDAERRQSGPRSALHGIPIVLKDNYATADMPTTGASRALEDFVPAANATAVQRLLDAGAIILGKTNLHEFAYGITTISSLGGQTRNPYDPARVPGGTSGGTAAAVAASFAAVGMGSDTCGSIRIPAAFNNLVGLRPTKGLGSIHGIMPLSSTQDVIGPLARSAYDLEMSLRLMAVPDVMEAPGLQVNLRGLHESTSALRVAVWDSDPMCPSSDAVVKRVRAVAQTLADQGAAVSDTARPEFSPEHSHEIFNALLASAMSARMPDADFAAMVARAERASPQDRSPVAQQARWQTLRARDWVRLNESRTKLRWAWHRFFERHDVLITPIMPTSAFAHDHKAFGQRTIDIDGQQLPYFNQTFWAGLAGVSYLPATVIPGGQGPDGLPIGVQLIGPAYSDMRLIQLAQRLEALGFAFTAPPACA